MTTAIILWARGKGRLIYDPHFWAISFIFVAISLIYWLYFYTEIDYYGDWRDWLWYLEITEFSNHINGSLFYIPLIYAAFIFWWRGTLITWLLSMAIIVPHVMEYTRTTTSLLTNMLFLSVPILMVAFISAELKWREKERKTMDEREAERQVYMSQIFKAQEDERRRIAQELHDDTMQTLLVIANRAQALVSDENSEISKQVKEQAVGIRDLALTISEDVRRLSLDLRPSILDEIGLVPALRWLVDCSNQSCGIRTKMIVRGENRKLKPETDVAVFRIVQEALSNMRRHSKATVAKVLVEFAPESLKITVRDNGKGFSLPKTIGNFTAEGKLGLIGMQQRAQFVNADFKVKSAPGKGTSVYLELTI